MQPKLALNSWSSSYQMHRLQVCALTLFYYFMCVVTLPACIDVYHMHAVQCSWTPKTALKPLGLELQMAVMLCECWEQNPGPLEEQPGHLKSHLSNPTLFFRQGLTTRHRLTWICNSPALTPQSWDYRWKPPHLAFFPLSLFYYCIFIVQNSGWC